MPQTETKSSPPAVDYLNKPIKSGDQIVYPVRQGSRLWLSRMTVTSVSEQGVLHGYTTSGRKTTVKNLSNTIVLPASEKAEQDATT